MEGWDVVSGVTGVRDVSQSGAVPVAELQDSFVSVFPDCEMIWFEEACLRITFSDADFTVIIVEDQIRDVWDVRLLATFRERRTCGGTWWRDWRVMSDRSAALPGVLVAVVRKGRDHFYRLLADSEERGLGSGRSASTRPNP